MSRPEPYPQAAMTLPSGRNLWIPYCPRCGALVLDTGLHEDWHQGIVEADKAAAEGG